MTQYGDLDVLRVGLRAATTNPGTQRARMKTSVRITRASCQANIGPAHSPNGLLAPFTRHGASESSQSFLDPARGRVKSWQYTQLRRARGCATWQGHTACRERPDDPPGPVARAWRLVLHAPSWMRGEKKGWRGTRHRWQMGAIRDLQRLPGNVRHNS